MFVILEGDDTARNISESEIWYKVEWVEKRSKGRNRQKSFREYLKETFKENINGMFCILVNKFLSVRMTNDLCT
jgi:hypothetical protein